MSFGEVQLSENDFLVSETDAKGTIIFANDDFCRLAGYTKEELLGQSHNIVRHPDMPKAAFADLWNTVKSNKVWQGYVKNKTKSGGFYWIFATVYPYKGENGEQCYMSCRRKPRGDLRAIEEQYRNMR